MSNTTLAAVNHNTCTCGCTEAHRVAVRRNADGIPVYFYSDGTITLGSAEFALNRPGYPIDAARLVMEDVSLYTSDEMPELLKASKRAAAKASRQKKV